MSTFLQFYNDPWQIDGLDKVKFEESIPSAPEEIRDLLEHALFKRQDTYYFNPINGLATWKEWRHFTWFLHKCITVRNCFRCLAADQCDMFKEKFELSITLGGPHPPIFGDEVMHYFDINEE